MFYNDFIFNFVNFNDFIKNKISKFCENKFFDKIFKNYK